MQLGEYKQLLARRAGSQQQEQQSETPAGSRGTPLLLQPQTGMAHPHLLASRQQHAGLANGHAHAHGVHLRQGKNRSA